MRIRRLFPLFLFGLSLALPLAAQADTVFLLQKGSIRRIEGTILRNVPGEPVSIQTSDGKTLVLNRNDIVNIVAGATSGTGSVREDTNPPLHDMTMPHLSFEDSKNPGIAMLLSFLLPGAGQFYNGEPVKGVVQLVGAVGGLALAVANVPATVRSNYINVDTGNSTLFAVGIGVTAASSLWSLIDAPLSASRINREQAWALQPTVTPSEVGLAAHVRF